MAYAVTRDPRYLDTIRQGYRTLRANHLYANGGYGPVELFYPADGSLGESLLYLDAQRDHDNGIPPGASAETTCGSWAGFKLSRYLVQFTGQAHYGDWIERLFYNAMGAALSMVGRGRTFYYSNYLLYGGHKYYHQTDWPVEFTLHVRQPGWAAAPLSGRLNGEPAALVLDGDGWLSFTRTWQAGDVLQVGLPMPLRFQPVDGQHPHRAA